MRSTFFYFGLLVVGLGALIALPGALLITAGAWITHLDNDW